MRSIRHLLAFLILAIPAATYAQIGVSITIGPPPIPVYEQPICPGDGYLWVPGYWAWDDGFGDYYWVPGTWVIAPEVGFLWTPGYWGWGGSGFLWNEGYWGPTVGFYGGVYYGFGYFGHGFEGGRWDHDHFFYNRSVMNIDVTNIHNVYNTRVENVTNITRVSYNGGKGGLEVRPSPEEERAAHERHIPPVREQTEHVSAARSNPELRAKANHGDPPVKATARPGEFNSRAGEAGRGAAGESRSVVHANELPPITHPEPPHSGNDKADAKYQKEQEKLIAKQEQERQKLQQQQEKEHQKQVNDAQRQQMEQKHQQQTQQLQQRHAQQMQSLQSRAPQPRSAPSRPR